MPQDIITIANQFRRALLRKERKAAIRLITAYGTIWAKIFKQLTLINNQIKEAKAASEIVNPAWLFRQERYGALLFQVDTEFRRFADVAEATITRQQSLAARAGLGDSVALMEAAAASAAISATFNKLPVAAVENLAGFLGNGSPLRTLLDQLPRTGRQIVEQGLIEGVALGRNPRAIATTIREGLGGNLNRALNLSRTEVLRVYRTASIQNYQANSDVVRGWIWRSSRSRRQCATCTALDGTFWPVSQPMKPHPRCRCTLIPAVRGVTVDKGPTWFNRQDADTQKAIIGTDAGYKAFKSGELKLEDFVGLRRDQQWGESFYQLSVKRAKAGEAQFPE